ncbi:peptide methionine sulfoxide reductase [Methylocella silvestris BL2]|uniref:Peptide methionine sulfoxide reductase MsrA n=1 Tax=Methylocella silvestris (strain DSM 15510 / CIP 108128 / LMG 27833 / NCIMB 13906 / BL2) TaxID=395965 RepID=B8ENA5_METSB|nr:peptide-methionine (S)-S-oxide reductase MsrA [Methylocella silvestris]ACK49618.1 peptide methionine sulfoxide reductase [Methylocella silvestris BL2]
MARPHEIAFPAGKRARRYLAPLLPAAAIIGLVSLGAAPSFAMEGKQLPAPAIDEPASQGATDTAVLAGGCFWGVQGVFEHVKGVTSAVSGYAGGGMAQAHYADVSTGATGHAESVRITFDPGKISYGRILQIFFSVAHDPTQHNRQGPDEGTQYRSAIFPISAEQAKIAKAYIAQLNSARVLEAPVATTIEPSRLFFPAEPYHQDFLARNPTYGYIVVNDLPKIENLKRLFPNEYRADPVLAPAER